MTLDISRLYVSHFTFCVSVFPVTFLKQFFVLLSLTFTFSWFVLMLAYFLLFLPSLFLECFPVSLSPFLIAVFSIDRWLFSLPLTLIFCLSLLISAIFDDPVLLFSLDPHSLVFYLMILCFCLAPSVGIYFSASAVVSAGANNFNSFVYLGCTCRTPFRKLQVWVYYLTHVCGCFVSVDVSSNRH